MTKVYSRLVLFSLLLLTGCFQNDKFPNGISSNVEESVDKSIFMHRYEQIDGKGFYIDSIFIKPSEIWLERSYNINKNGRMNISPYGYQLVMNIDTFPSNLFLDYSFGVGTSLYFQQSYHKNQIFSSVSGVEGLPDTLCYDIARGNIINYDMDTEIEYLGFVQFRKIGVTPTIEDIFED